MGIMLEKPMADQPLPAETVRDVAGFLSVFENTIYRFAQQGKLPGFMVAGTWRVQLQDIQGWINDQRKQPGKEKISRISVVNPTGRR
jgi:excisionase family DNA binding protein